MHTKTARTVLAYAACIVTLMVSSGASAATRPQAKPAGAPLEVASYVSICRNAHGSLDRRACRHAGRLDPQRVTIALR